MWVLHTFELSEKTFIKWRKAYMDKFLILNVYYDLDSISIPTSYIKYIRPQQRSSIYSRQVVVKTALRNNDIILT